jgi:hypothetical protein
MILPQMTINRRLIVAIFLILCTTTRAFDLYDVVVNNDNSAVEQNSPRVASGNDGLFVVVWADKRSGQSDIYFQFFDGTGHPLGTNRKLNDDQSLAPQLQPAVDAGNSNAFLGVWKDYRNGDYPFHPDIYFSVVDTTEMTADRNVTSDPPDSTCDSPDIAVLNDGGAIVVWADYRNLQWDIYGRVIGPDGDFAGPVFKINSDAGINQQHSPRVAPQAGDGFVVVWHDDRSGDDDIFARRFDTMANPLGEDFRVSDDPLHARQAFPAVASDGNGAFAVCWVDWRNGNYPYNPDIYCRRFNPAGTPTGPSMRINPSDGGRAQRDVSLCADFMGNLCVVWADSSSGEWNAMAQIVDYRGIIAGAPFRIHKESSGRQLQPDVASDGYKLYFVWADSRSGDFDILMSIKQYNNPSLVPDPKSLNFSMELGGALPEPQEVSLTNAGYGELDWALSTAADWLAVDPSQGMTPGTFEVSIITDSMPYGSHHGNIRLINLDNNDSTESVAVTLTVTAPLMQVLPDTLFFRALIEVGNPPPQRVEIDNAGSGTFNWTAEESSSWIEINPYSGGQSESTEVEVDITGMICGRYREPIVFYSSEAVNSPETVWVDLEILGDMPYLNANPERLTLSGTVGDTLVAELEIINLGGGFLNWTAAPDDGWVYLNKASGVNGDTIIVTVESWQLASGFHQSQIRVYDSNSFNIEVDIPLDIYLSCGDTVQFFSTNAMPGGIGVVPLYIYLGSSAKGGYIPFAYDDMSAALDSLVFNPHSFPFFVSYYADIGPPGRAEVGFLICEEFLVDSVIPAGTYNLCNLFFTAGDSSCFNRIDTLCSDSSGPYLLKSVLTKGIPTVLPGELIIGDPTLINGDERDIPACRAPMLRNYPNPFNSSTTIEVFLPEKSDLTLKICNILGQTVCVLHDGILAPGRHLFTWDGTTGKSVSAPSGIYFGLLLAESAKEIRKMVLIK